MGLLLELDEQAAFENHLHFHNVLIKANLLYFVFLASEQRGKQRRASSSLCLL